MTTSIKPNIKFPKYWEFSLELLGLNCSTALGHLITHSNFCFAAEQNVTVVAEKKNEKKIAELRLVSQFCHMLQSFKK